MAREPRMYEPPLWRMQPGGPIFAEPDRTYTTCLSAQVVNQDASGVELEVAVTGEAEPAILQAGPTASGALRLRWRSRRGAVPPVSDADGMLAAGAVPGSALLDRAEDDVTLRTEAWTWKLSLRTLSWELSGPAGPIVRQQRQDWNFNTWVSRPLGTTWSPTGAPTWSYESLELSPSERLYGLGQQYGPVEKRGSRSVLWNQDAQGVNGAALSYHNVPFVWSTAGWGAVVHAGGRVACELGEPSYGTATLAAEGDCLDLFLIVGETPARLLEEFYKLAGPVPGIEPWAFGIWMSRCFYRSRDEVLGVVDRLEALEMPFDVVHLDPAWMRRYGRDDQYGTDFNWNDEAFGPREEFFAEMRARSLRVSLWENPYPYLDTDTSSALAAIGGLATTPDGEFARPTEAPTVAGIADFTNPAARAWWVERNRELLTAGAASFKTDFGEGVPEAARFSDGRSGAEIHNLYSLLYNRAVFDGLTEAGLTLPVVFARSGWLGSHRYPLQWSGDARSTWEDLRGALRAGLSAALSGPGYWASDIGGFYSKDGPPDGELYARWAWFGCLSAIARFHGTSPREPYEFAGEIAAAAVGAARLRYALLPYLLRSAPGGRVSDLPLMRPLVLHWPDDPLAREEQTEYLLGPDLLVAPVLEPGGRRTVYLPAGEWGDWWTGDVRSGPLTLEVDVPLDRVPLYQRAGTTVEVGAGRRVEEVLAGPIQVKCFDESWEARS